MLEYGCFKESFQGILDGIPIISRDSKLTVYRFGKNNYRIICKHKDNIMYVIRFDFDYSAYDHG
ncbi:MAG: hypothetical protein IJ736_05325 [Firmicutes bacterium]|nr:hypothetical protein [Bacillota bacterium]